MKMPTVVAAILLAGLVGMACSSSGLRRSAGEAGAASGGQAGSTISSGTTGGSGGTVGPGGAGGVGIPAGLPAGVTDVKSDNNDSITIDSNYAVENNEWNYQAASQPYSESIFQGVSNGTSFFGWQWSWNSSNQGTVLSYPEVFCGWSPWLPAGFHSPGYPYAIAGHTFHSTFDITMTTSTISGGDTYDLAYDIWIIKSTSDPTNFTASDIKCELMIWLDSKNATPDGVAPSGSLSANGYTFDYYYSPNQSSGTTYNWIYAAFSQSTPIYTSPVGDFDITPFLTYLTTNGVLSPDDYVATVELGTEVAIGAGQAVIRSYSVTVQ